jgi:CoA:oxalate CoA-transferase
MSRNKAGCARRKAVSLLERLRENPRFTTNADRMRNRDTLRAEVETVTRTHDQAYWIAKLNQAGVPCGPVLSLAQVFADPQVQHSEMAIEVEHPGYSTVKMLGFPLKLSDIPCSVRHHAPELGAGTEAVLSCATAA